ncbi:MAG: TRAP transporter small permease [Candidatus Methylomirabilales bacterium]
MMRAVLRGLDRLLDAVTIVILVVLLGVVGVQIFARYVLNHSLYWSEELARYLFIYLVFLGAAVALRRDGHIRVSFLVDRLPAGLQRATAVLVDLVVLVFAGTVLWQSVRLAAMVWTVPTAAMLIPWTFVYLGILLGMAAATLAALGSLLARARRPEGRA